MRLFGPVDHLDHLRIKLDNLKQTGSLDDYIANFRVITTQINRGMSDDEKRHRFIEGLNEVVRTEVRFRKSKNLEEAIELAVNVDRTMKMSGRQVVKPESALVVSRKGRDYRNDAPRNHSSGGHKGKFTRPKSRVENNSRPRRQITCYKCGKLGHVSKNCRVQTNNSLQKKRQVNTVQLAQNEQPQTGQQLIVKPMSTQFNKSLVVATSYVHSPRIFGFVNGIRVLMIIDTGADVSCISRELVSRNSIKCDITNNSIETASGREHSVYRTESLLTVVAHTQTKMSYVVLSLPSDVYILLGVDWLNTNKVVVDTAKNVLHFKAREIQLSNSDETVEDECILAASLNSGDDWICDIEDEWAPKFVVNVDDNIENELKGKVIKFVTNNKDLFASSIKELGCCTIGEHIINTGDSKPIFIPPWRRSEGEKKIIEREVKSMLKAGIIRPSNSLWSAPVHLVPKESIGVRFCVDYRRLNEVTVVDPFPLPRTDDTHDNLAGSSVFSKLDFKSGYWQIRMEEKSIPKTAFSVHNGHYEFIRLPFGLKNAPSDFARLMIIILGHLKFVQNYFDDIYVHSSTVEEHFEHLSIVFDILRSHNLKINAEKCAWFTGEIEVLGFIVSGHEIKMDKNKIRAISERKPPDKRQRVSTISRLNRIL